MELYQSQRIRDKLHNDLQEELRRSSGDGFNSQGRVGEVWRYAYNNITSSIINITQYCISCTCFTRATSDVVTLFM
jgi:hypothetical protein